MPRRPRASAVAVRRLLPGVLAAALLGAVLPVGADAPSEPARLEALGKTAYIIFMEPPRTGDVARDSVVAWRFNDRKIGHFKPGQFIAQDGQPRRFKLVDVKRAETAVYHLVYDVYDDPNGRPVKTGQVLVHDARPRR